MDFYSTNGQSRHASLEEAVMTGLAPDGGLFMPERIPVIPRAFFNNIAEMSVSDIAYVVATTVLGEDIEASELKQIVFDTFSFEIPLRNVDNDIYALELFHGPTLAFKDVGARFLARIISHYSRPHDKEVNVLVATSGDSGGAVAAGFHKVPGVKVFVLYPERGLSALQRHQFTSLGDNVYPIEIMGTFDDCQRVVKEAFTDENLREDMHITSANSINVCRLLPQMFYYFYGYSQFLRHEGETADGVVVSVPCGNLGNLTAGLLARKMGLPIKRFVVANNRNAALSNYLKTGVFRSHVPYRTIACAMDVGNPSNFARILDLYNGDYEAIRNDMHGYALDDEEIADSIRRIYHDNNYIMDPHGATAYEALRRDLRPEEKGIFLATAHPAKFPRTLESLTGVTFKELEVPQPNGAAEHHTTPRITPSLPALKKVLLSAT
ncbi:MAG: threonine synthase [Staphylococcus sp.]|nr:threonine synthase [Staphylococcus sp.]